MPKQSGQDNRTVRGPSRPQPASRSIMSFSPSPSKSQAPAKPLMSSAPSNKTAAHAVHVASHPGEIDPRQQHN
jgi:hypothetical protein